MTQNTEKEKVLFICTHNSARSQMAEGLMNALYGSRYEAYSAGTEPSPRVNPAAVAVMAEIGIDISSQHPKSVVNYQGVPFDMVVTVCDSAQETCPFFPAAKKQMHRGFEDPSQFHGPEDKKLAVFRRIRDEIKEWIENTFGDTASLSL